MSDEQTDSERMELVDFEKAIFAELKPEAEDPVLDLPPAELPSEDPVNTDPAPAKAAPAATAAATPAPTPATPEEGATGDVRAALRAARRAERQAREEARQLREQLAARGEPKQSESEADHDLADLEVNVPQAANLVKRLQAQIKELTSKVAPTVEPAAAAPPFAPDTLPPELQTAVEAVPQIEDWQHDQDQTAWTLAKRMDGLLIDHPAWKDKPVVDRLKEVARRVRAELGTPSTPPAAVRAGKVIANAPERDIETLSDLRGGAAPTNQGPDFHSMKSDDEVMAALRRL